MASWTDDPDTFHVIVRSLLKPADEPDDTSVITARIQKLFGEICALPTCQIKMGSVFYVKSKPEKINPQDIVVHLVGAPGDSIITKFKRLPIDSNPNAAGRTYVITNGNISEVYAKAPYCDEPELLANMIVHEAMHNKLSMDDPTLHGKTDFVGAPGGFAQENLPRDKALAWTTTDKNLLAPNLHKQEKQEVH